MTAPTLARSFVLAVTAAAVASLSSCDSGSLPGETPRTDDVAGGCLRRDLGGGLL